MLESTIYIKHNRISPKKLRFILDDVRTMRPDIALTRLQLTTTRTSKVLSKALKSAITAATATLKSTPDLLQFKTLLVEEGPRLKRMRPGARGMGRKFVKRSSQIKITLIQKNPVISKPDTSAKVLPVGKRSK